ncbi:hypothetical protein E2C01_093656 [Portunus trituberculatus]|uniref:Uncharacterized protein n=1 Tax=Portunus trituberculatus TaxID=210409 RepID=A0A5B7JV06_PORTR|nr:hypothetical protein [Portunus trituberculatus]
MLHAGGNTGTAESADFTTKFNETEGNGNSRTSDVDRIRMIVKSLLQRGRVVVVGMGRGGMQLTRSEEQ